MELDLQSMELHMDLLLLALDTELDHQLVDLHLHLEREPNFHGTPCFDMEKARE